MIGVFCLIDEFHTVLRFTLLGVCSILYADCLHSYYDAWETKLLAWWLVSVVYYSVLLIWLREVRT